MSYVSEVFKTAQFHRMATIAYVKLIKEHSVEGKTDLCDYMQSIGMSFEASNNQLTFWARASRSPFRDRIVLEMAGPQDQLLARNYSSVRRTVYYVGYYLSEGNVAAIQREMENEPDKMEDARALLKDRANDQDPALRHRSLSTSIAQ
jgi:hypothetical protein